MKLLYLIKSCVHILETFCCLNFDFKYLLIARVKVFFKYNNSNNSLKLFHIRIIFRYLK